MEQGALSLLFVQHIRSLALSVTQDQIRQCVTFTSELKAWNETANLTSITEDEAIVVKHFVDSLVALKAADIEHGASILDVGTGAGFPAIPLKIVRPDLSFLLIDPAHKKVSFLRYIVGRLKLESVSIFCGTLKEFIDTKAQKHFQYVTFRAVNYRDVLDDCLVVLSDAGQVILYSSKPLSQQEIGPRWSIVRELSFNLPSGYGSRTVSFLKRVDLQCST